ncbi:MAG: CBS domain-containing protein [Deltaproteobacteria bacterium]|nr:CBS domain-containing protein [Deltaproteobacteria bacterium]
MLVGRRMTKDPKTVSPEDTLARAAGIMRELRINHLPVVEGGKLVGILTDTDLRNVSLTGEPEAGGARPPDRRVREVMKTDVWSLTPEDAVEDALLIIRRKRFGALPVLSGDRLVGIITKIDLLNAVIDVLNLEEVGVRIEVSFPRSMDRFEELMSSLAGMSVKVRSCIVTPDEDSDRMTALIRLDTIEGQKVISALRAKGFDVPGRAELS